MGTFIYTIPDFNFNQVSTSFSYSLTFGKIMKVKELGVEKEELRTSKQRILTYFRNELHFLKQEDIAYVYIENKITYVVDKDANKRVANKSLELLLKELERKDFFRVNRQFIVAENAIKKIIKIGNNKLKIETNPESEKVITIGKNKVAAFKKWLKAENLR